MPKNDYLVNGFGAVYGGIVRVHDAVVRELATSGRVSVACSPRGGYETDVQVLSRQSEGRLGSLLGDLRAALRFERFDMRIDTAPGFRFFTRAKSHVVIVHDLNFRDRAVHQLSFLNFAYRWVLHNWTLRRADTIIVNSESTKSEVRDFLPSAATKTHVLPLPVDYLGECRVEMVRDFAEEEEEEIRLLSFGHARNKGIGHLLQLLAERDDIALTVICREQAWEELWAPMASELDVVGRVRVTGRLSDDELISEYRRADVFCMLSDYEGYGLPVAEALYVGTPVIVSSIPVLHTTGRGFPVVCEALEPEGLSRALKEVLDLPEEHWQAARQEFASWDWAAWVDSMLKIATSAVSRKNGGPRPF